MTPLARLALLLAALPLAACQTNNTIASAPPPSRAKNVILFVGDGMGISTITAARIYEGQKRGMTGEENILSFERLPNAALVKTYNTDAQVPDSAGTATAMNAGVKTRIGFVGVSEAAERGDCTSGKANPLPLVAEAAKRARLQVGIVTTTRITHATPAAVYGHSVSRDWEADKDIPAAERREGCRDLAAQLTAFPFDIALGGGKAKFSGNQAGGERLEPRASLAQEWADRTGGTYVETAAALAAAPQGRPVLGLFAPSHLTYMLDRKPESTEPTLTEMTAAALARLKADGRGFYLMVEGGRIDHAHHAGQAGYALEETVEFARAVQHAIDNTDPAETLILVTADHSHVFHIAGYPKRGNPILGLVTGGGEGEGSPDAPAVALDGQPYTTLGYGNGPGAVKSPRPAPDTSLKARQQALVPLPAETHGGEDVALYAGGPGSGEVRGVMEQSRIGQIIMRALGLR
ncbi:alkaline phosphatase [Qipengyuania sediminis]|uniref:alkaline phosphatase n=1 Tax=Qipengyuania sediminis TaxID=1532023 RepID=UPI00105A738E|nr:alkaline phosphatase [Qipengyuania sediminis]